MYPNAGTSRTGLRLPYAHGHSRRAPGDALGCAGPPLPLLRVAAQHLDASPRTFDADQLADEAGLSEQDAKLAGRALIDRGYLTGDYRKAPASFDLAMVFFTGVTEKGARAAGLWPSEQSVEAFQAGCGPAVLRAGRGRRGARAAATISWWPSYLRATDVERRRGPHMGSPGRGLRHPLAG